MVLSIALVVACADPSTSDAPATTDTDGPAMTTAGSTSTIHSAPLVALCSDTGYPSAPDDWYADTPIYVGNEMPVDAIQAFASGLEGYETIWIDRDHHRWVISV